MLGTPLGRAEFVHAQLNQKLADHDTLLSRIPLVADVQSAWALLLHCAGARANFMLRVVRPELVHDFAEGHIAGLWRCLARIIPTSVGADGTAKATASLPLAMGGMGLRDASRTSQPAFWASWADCLSMVNDRHPDVATMMVRQLSGVDDCESPSLQAAPRAAQESTGVEGFEVPSWEALVRGARPPPHEVDDYEPGEARHGWQHEAASRVERLFRIHLMERLAEHQQALLCSQSRPTAGMALSASPSNFLTRIEPHLFRVVLLRRLRLPLPSLCVPVVVAVFWTPLAIIELRVPELACWGDGDLQSECCHSIVPRRRRQSGDERHASRLGPSSACCTRWAEVGDHR